MNKIIYLKTSTEVEIGSTIELNEIKLKITDDLIKDNPDLFEVVEEIPEYIKYIQNGGNCSNHKFCKESIKNIGQVNTIYKVDSIFEDIYGNSYVCTFPNKVCLRVDCCKLSTKEKYLLQEVKKRYKVGDKVRSLKYPNLTGIITNEITSTRVKWSNNEYQYIDLYVDDNWVEIVKDLPYYENLLLQYKTPLYVELKEKEPKLYWLKVLQLIADDLNKNKITDEFYAPTLEYNKIIPDNYFLNDGDYGFIDIKFDSKESCDKAIEILGDNLKVIFE